jgi:hypothetical protein
MLCYIFIRMIDMAQGVPLDCATLQRTQTGWTRAYVHVIMHMRQGATDHHARFP